MIDLWLVLYSFGSSEALAPGRNMLLNRGALNPGQGRGPATTNQTRLHFLRYQKQHSRRLAGHGGVRCRSHQCPSGDEKMAREIPCVGEKTQAKYLDRAAAELP